MIDRLTMPETCCSSDFEKMRLNISVRPEEFPIILLNSSTAIFPFGGGLNILQTFDCKEKFGNKIFSRKYCSLNKCTSLVKSPFSINNTSEY